MEASIRKYLEMECTKLIARHESHIRQRKRDQKRFKKRTGKTAGDPKSFRPEYWDANPHFDPYYVRSRLKSISHGLAESIRAGKYQVSPAYCFSIPKPGGGKREVTIFSVPDSAVSHYLYRELLRRNGHRFSSYCFAYRPDRTAHFAVEHLFKAVERHKRLFILEYDFAKYFDTISHGYLESLLRRELQVSPREQWLSGAFLRFKRARGLESFRQNTFEDNNRGIAQGNSLSLFLANVACLELDRELESTGATFARYADDTVILCRDYEQANKCADLMLSHGRRSATEVNFEKSDGISLLTPEKEPEMRPKSSFHFLGYKIGAHGISLSPKAVKRIKKRISTIIHRHLLLYPKRKQFNPDRIRSSGLDWDMVTCINEIRRSLYGHVTEKTVSGCLGDKSKPLTLTKGLLSYYPLIDQAEIFQELDGWMLDVVHRAQIARKKLVKKSGAKARIYTKREILRGRWYRLKKPPVETQLPSFFRAWLYIRKCLQVYGLMTFRSADYAYYSA
jgi:retron-type reverse transcriptase